MPLRKEQIEVLLRPIKPGRVVHREGQSNLEAYDVRAHLTRIFGFGGWDEIAVHTELLYEEETTTKAGKPAFKVAYRADRAIVIRDNQGRTICEYHGTAVGEAIMPDFKRGDAHDFAVKKAQSQALKRAAINLGDQFGLSLYAKGSIGALIGKVVGQDAELHQPDVVEETDPDAVPDQTEEQMVDPRPHDFIHQQPEVQPLPLDQTLMVTDGQIKKIQTLFGIKGIKDRDAKLVFINERLGTTQIESSKQLSFDEASIIIRALEG